MMNPLSISMLALAMSTDAFAVSVVKGTEMRRPNWGQALRTGAIFGVIEALTPVIGWLLGAAASSYIQRWDHWIAFMLLVGLGGRTLYMGLRDDRIPTVDAGPAPPAAGQPQSFWVLALTGLATSIDAMAVGVSLAFLNVAIVPVALAIGFATFVMVTLGVMLGKVFGVMIGRWAERLGGVVLIAIGCMLLLKHLVGGA